jgi:hypothetical protein
MRGTISFEATDHGTDGPESGENLSDEELTALALAADPDQPLGADAVPMSLYSAEIPDCLPRWYMPPVVARRSGGWRTPLVLAIVAAFFLIDALGLCSTYGPLVFA